MDLPGPPHAVSALATFIRDRLTGMAGTVSPVLGRGAGQADAAARHLVTVVIGATAPFAPNSYSRARLIRQMHASGLLSTDESTRTCQVLAIGAGDPGAA